MADDIFDEVKRHVTPNQEDTAAKEKEAAEAAAAEEKKAAEDKTPEGDKKAEDAKAEPEGQKKEEPNKQEPTGKSFEPDEVLEALEKDEALQYRFLSKKLGRDIKSFDDLVEEKVVEKEPELPGSVKSFWDYVKNTGRDNLSDFIRATKDWSDESKESVVMEYIRRTQGYSGDELKEYVKDRFFPNEEEVSAREQKMAKYDFNALYNEGLDHLKKEQETYRIPDKPEAGRQDDAAAQANQDQEKFAKGIQEAIKQFDEVKVSDNFSYKLGGEDRVGDIKTMDDVIKQFSGPEGFNYRDFVKTLFVGKNIDKIVKAHSDHVKNNLTEEDIKRMSNSSVDPDRNAGKEGISAKDVLSTLNKIV